LISISWKSRKFYFIIY